MEHVTFISTMLSTQFRMIFGGKHRYQKEYDRALDILQVSSHWLHLYKALEGPKAVQVCVALEKWVEAYPEKDTDFETAKLEKELKHHLHVLIYGPDYIEGWHGYDEN